MMAKAADLREQEREEESIPADLLRLLIDSRLVDNDSDCPGEEACFSHTGIQFPDALLNTNRLMKRIERPSLSSKIADTQLSFEFTSPAEDPHEPPQKKQELVDIPTVVVSAYVDVRGTASTDLVLVDPALNSQFIQRCWRLGVAAPAELLNSTLINARKNSLLSGLPPAAKFSIDRPILDQFSFASEFALRLLQERYYFVEQRDISLDKILCSPELAGEFDAIARRIAPGFTSLQYRWAALVLRKAFRSQPAQASVPIS